MAELKHGPIVRPNAAALPFYEYEDVDLAQRNSDIRSRDEVSLKTRFSQNIELNIPLVASSMATVTESNMAIAMGLEGGLGIIHRFMSVERQVEELIRVKRAANYIIEDPLMLTPVHTVAHARELVAKHGVGGIMIVNDLEERHIVGIVTTRDLLGASATQELIDVMTQQVFKKTYGISLEEAERYLYEIRKEKLPLVDERNRLCGLITQKDIEKQKRFPNAARDKTGRLWGAAAVGLKDLDERAAALVAAGADVLVIDIAHGGMSKVVDAIRYLSERYPRCDVVAGNLHEPDIARAHIIAGSDALRVGIAPGQVCETRRNTGVGGSQMTAVLRCAEAAWVVYNEQGFLVPIIADGGIRNPGDIGKALAGGASTVMIGTIFAGTDESPGPVIRGDDGQLYKAHFGMASDDAAMLLREVEGTTISYREQLRTSPEGRRILVPVKGSVRDLVAKYCGWLRSTMSYIGARTIDEMPKRAIFNPRG